MSQPEATSGTASVPLIGALLALCALVGLVIMPRLAPAGGKLSGRPAPDFSLPVIANGDPGARVKLSELRDKVVVLDFWASWCGPCAMQAPILERIAQRHRDDVVVLGINVCDSPQVARSYVRNKRLSYPNVADDEGEVQAKYGASTLPTVVLIDRSGNIHTFVQGMLREAAIERAIRSLKSTR